MKPALAGLLCVVAACDASTGPSSLTAQPPPEWAVHYGDEVLRYDIEIDPATWQAMRADPLCEGEIPCGDAYVRATFRFGDQVVAPVGVRLKGNTSRVQVQLASDACDAPSGGCPRERCPGWRRYSLKVHFGYFVDEQRLDGIEKLNLNNVWGDPSYLREPLAYEMLRRFDVPASRAGYANVYVNGEHQGLFVSVQQVDRAFLEHEGFFGGRSGGNLFKVIDGDLRYRGDAIADYDRWALRGVEAYELKTNRRSGDYSGLIRLMKVLDEHPESLGGILEIDRFLSWLAVNTLVVALDSYVGTIPHNFYLYEHPKTGRFTLIPWDLNGAFAGFDCADPALPLAALPLTALPIDAPYCPNSDPWLVERILSVPEHRDAYHAKLRDLLDDPFRMERLQAAVEALGSRVAPSVEADPSAFYGRPSECGAIDRGQGEAARGNQDGVAVDGRPGLLAFLEARTAWVCAELRPTWAGGAPPARCAEVGTGCGDGICMRGEDLPGAGFCDDCRCEPCFKLLPGSGCVPICNAEYCAECPAGWSCEPELGLCRPRGRRCPDGFVLGPYRACEPDCRLQSGVCEPLGRSCRPTDGLCR